MTDVRLYLSEIENSNKPEATKIAQRTAERLQTKELRLVDLVESCGEYFNHESAVTRERTMSFLAEVLTAVPNGVLLSQHRALLLEFVISRIEDREVGIGSGAKALLALEERGKWTPDVASRILTSLLRNTHPLIENGSQAQRYPVLLLIDMLMAKYRSTVTDLNASDSTLLPRFVSYFDGEKDPRNLMVVFSILAVVTTEWDVSSSIQEVFDASFNYFPITFRPPPDDVYKITAQDLKDRLRKCIAANSALAPYAYPALLDKLDSTSPNTKRDVLQTILDTTFNYGPRTVALYSVTLWDAIKFEVLQNQEEDLAQQSLEVLAGIAKSLSTGSEDALQQYLKPVVKECNEHFEDAPTKQSDAALRMLTCIAPTSASAYNIVVSGVLPEVLQLYKASKDVSKKRSLVEVLDKLTAASVQAYGDWTHVPTIALSESTQPTSQLPLPENALKQFGPELYDTIFSALSGSPAKSVSFRLALIDAALQLCKARGLWKDKDISNIIKVFNDIILIEEPIGKEEVKSAATKALAALAEQKPQLVVDYAFPAFLSRIPDNDGDYHEPYIPALEAFAKLGAEEQVFKTVLVRLRNKINAALHQGASSRYIHDLLSAMLYTFGQARKPLPGIDNDCPYYSDYVKPLMTTIQNWEQRDDAAFAVVGRIANEVIRDQSADFQSSTICPTIYPATMSTASNGDTIMSNGSTHALETQRLVLTVHLLAALHRNVALPFNTMTVIDSLLTTLADAGPSPDVKAAALQHISLLVNKFVPKPDIGAKLHPIIQQILDDRNNPYNVQITFCILKALLYRNDPLINSIVPKLITSLQDRDSGLAVAYGFSSLLQPDTILTKQNHCVISPLHKHKTFAIVVPAIAAAFRSADDALVKRHYLIALSGILRWLPYAVLEPELESLTPLLLQSLDIQGENEIKAGTINELTVILAQNSKALEGHASSLITRLLGISGTGNTADLRSKALQCLTVVASQLRTEIIVPFRKPVVQNLTAALDDRKRAVRAEAVRCRRRWIELDAADDDADEAE